MRVRQAREAGDVLAELRPLVLAECQRPVSANAGASGTAFEVLVYVGDEFIAKHKDATRGKIVLTLGDVGFAGRTMRPDIVEICNASLTFEAHVWTPEVRQDRTEATAGAQRINAHLSMIECIVRALYTVHHGAVAPPSPPVTALRLARDTEVLRHGQAAVLTFPLVLAIYEGQPLTLLPDGSSIAPRWGSTSDPTPPIGEIAGELIVNPEN